MTADASIIDTIPAGNVITGEKLGSDELIRLSAKGERFHLVDCDLHGTKATRLSFDGWAFVGCDIQNANFLGANLISTFWRKCKGGTAFFRAATLEDARFEGCDLNNTNFEGAGLADSAFERCKLVGADFTVAKSLNIHFENCLLGDAKLAGMSFRGKTLRSVRFDHANLNDCDFRDVTFTDCSLREADLGGCRFQGANLVGAEITGITLKTMKLLKGATISANQSADLLAEAGIEVV